MNCAFRHVINFEESRAIEAPDAVVAVAAKQADKSHCALVNKIFDNERQLDHTFQVSTKSPLRLKKRDMLSTRSAKEKCFYQNVIAKSRDEAVDIALTTKLQASVGRFVGTLYLVHPPVFSFTDEHTLPQVAQRTASAGNEQQCTSHQNQVWQL